MRNEKHSNSLSTRIKMNQDGNLLKISEALPSEFGNFFPYESFNHMQSAILPQALHSNLNMVVAAPTGCGKTVIHEIAIIRLISKSVKNMKVVYIAPNKALCQQKLEKWNQKFTKFGLSVMEVTGDSDLKYCLRLVAKASIIITTPEKWDSLTRSWKDHVFLLGAIDLLLLDEVHHLGDERGSTLEIVVVRMRLVNQTCLSRIKEHCQSNTTTTDNSDIHESMRIIALSATLPNLADIGDWIGCAPDSVHYFDDSFRPVPLTIHTLAMGNMNNPFLFERSLDSKVGDVITRYSEGKQTLIFCSSKKSTESLCGVLVRQLGRKANHNHREIADRTSGMQDTQLKELIGVGYAYHHGGLPPDDRMIVEHLYLAGLIKVLCSTSTLAHGVNLPAHLVVIKGTNCWRGGSRGYEKMCRSEIIQMLGRAGRPGFDNNGVAVIMTSTQDRDYYAAISLSADVVESTLQGILVEAICSEISQAVVQDLAQCLTWIKSTFFYVRVRKNPASYGFKDTVNSTAGLDTALEGICKSAFKQLSAAGIVELSNSLEMCVSPRTEAHIMTRSLIKFDTMTMLIQLPVTITLTQLLKDFSKSKELCKPVRKQEKRILNDFMKAIRFPLKERVQDPWHKAYVLMQAAVGRLDLKDFALKVEQSEIVESGLRILSALAELCKAKSFGLLLENTILLDRSLRCRMWEHNYGSVFLQCPGLTDATRNGLVLRGIRTVGDIEGCSLHRVQELAQCSAVEAREILHFVQILSLSRMSVRATVERSPDGKRQLLQIQVDSVSSEASSKSVLLPVEQYPNFQLLCYEMKSSKILCYRKLSGAQVGKSNSFSVTLSSADDIRTEDVRCCLLSSIVGNDSAQGSYPNPQVTSTAATQKQTVSKTTTTTAANQTVKSATTTPIDSRITVSAPPVPTAHKIQNNKPIVDNCEPQHQQQQTDLESVPNRKLVGAASRVEPTFESWQQRFAYKDNQPPPPPPQDSEERRNGNHKQLFSTSIPYAEEGVYGIESGSATNIASIPVISRDLAVLRAKAAEMQYDHTHRLAKRPRAAAGAGMFPVAVATQQSTNTNVTGGSQSHVPNSLPDSLTAPFVVPLRPAPQQQVVTPFFDCDRREVVEFDDLSTNLPNIPSSTVIPKMFRRETMNRAQEMSTMPSHNSVDRQESWVVPHFVETTSTNFSAIPHPSFCDNNHATISSGKSLARVVSIDGGRDMIKMPRGEKQSLQDELFDAGFF